ncbi:MAG: AAA family ATPase, partial [Prevotellaceae bacterium]|nr:AAA family ATPase [Prevotellaceae bacterium]
METKLKKLPIGIQTFEEIRNENYIYVDKTRYLVKLIDTGKIYFFARPRRFGKSLTISTFEAMFSGKKELFEGLAAEEFMNRANYRTSPVIRLDMSLVSTSSGTDTMRESMLFTVRKIAKNLDVELSNISIPGNLLGELIENTCRKYNSKVVVLLDEYDKPYNEYVNDRERAEKIREILRDFYIQIKSYDEYIRFVFITGIGKFAKFGVFSGLNNPADISMDEEYGEMCGLTKKEIVKYFPEYIEATAKKFKITTDELLEKMRNYYDGFCFDGVHRLYNPFSTVNFFARKDFQN